MSSNKRIAKNTMFLYIRMFVNMAIGLYTSRVILSVLGIQDYGIYNLVGGVVVLFSFLNNSMTSATQRFFNISIASKEILKIKEVFNTGLKVHFFVAGIILILAETIGLWFLNHKLVIPHEKMWSSNLVYQASVVTALIGILRIPYNVTILAHERMSFYAILSIAESLLKLGIVYILLLLSKDIDKLSTYSFLVLFVGFFVTVLYVVYCRLQFRQETEIMKIENKTLFREMIGFSSWSLFGNIAVLGSNQGLAIILNMFLGVAINAAVGIANQVNTTLYTFVSNVQVASNPQLIQSYSLGEYERHKTLIFSMSKFSFYLMLILAIPVLLYSGLILNLWLGNNLPDYVVIFTKLVIIGSLIEAIAGPFWMSANAIGKIQAYQISISLILILNLPVSYILLKCGYSPVVVMVSKVLLSIVTMIYRFIYINSKIRFGRKNIWSYIKSIFFVIIYVIVCFFVGEKLSGSNIPVALAIVVGAELMLFAIILATGLTRVEVDMLKKIVLRKK